MQISNTVWAYRREPKQHSNSIKVGNQPGIHRQCYISFHQQLHLLIKSVYHNPSGRTALVGCVRATLWRQTRLLLTRFLQNNLKQLSRGKQHLDALCCWPPKVSMDNVSILAFIHTMLCPQEKQIRRLSRNLRSWACCSCPPPPRVGDWTAVLVPLEAFNLLSSFPHQKDHRASIMYA